MPAEEATPFYSGTYFLSGRHVLHVKPSDRRKLAVILWLSFTDFTAPLSVEGSGSKEPVSISEDAVAMIISMGFTQAQAIKALKATVSMTKMLFVNSVLIYSLFVSIFPC